MGAGGATNTRTASACREVAIARNSHDPLVTSAPRWVTTRARVPGPTDEPPGRPAPGNFRREFFARACRGTARVGSDPLRRPDASRNCAATDRYRRTTACGVLTSMTCAPPRLRSGSAAAGRPVPTPSSGELGRPPPHHGAVLQRHGDLARLRRGDVPDLGSHRRRQPADRRQRGEGGGVARPGPGTVTGTTPRGGTAADRVEQQPGPVHERPLTGRPDHGDGDPLVHGDHHAIRPAAGHRDRRHLRAAAPPGSRPRRCRPAATGCPRRSRRSCAPRPRTATRRRRPGCGAPRAAGSPTRPSRGR